MDFADLAFAILGVGALLAASLPHVVQGRPFSLPIVFLVLGVALGLLPILSLEARPEEHLPLIEHLTEVVVIVALMGAGLGLDRRVGWRSWANTWRLLAITMPLTILAVVVLGMGLLGLAPAAAVLLGAALAPTDPVLAGEVQVGEPAAEPADGRQAEDEIRFSLTSEAGLNDALAFPFVYLAIAMAAASGAGIGTWGLEWFGVDVAYRIVVGALGGLAVGWLLSRLFFSTKLNALRGSRTERDSIAFFGIRGIGSIYYLAYGLTSADLSADAADLYAVVALVIVGSIALHGITAGPWMQRLDAARGLIEQEPPAPARQAGHGG